MTVDQWVVLAILGVALAVFAADRVRVDVVALSVLVTLVLSGLLTSEEALSGLSNPAVVTVLAVFILSGAMVSTGVADTLARVMMKAAGDAQWRIVTVAMVTCGLMSAFMNNIGATAILLPACLRISERTGIAASKLLMPLAFASLMGGNITAIGTPPNILANGILSERDGLEPFRFFDFAATGIPVLLLGLLYMAIIGFRLLPSRSDTGRLVDNTAVSDYLSTVTVGPTSSLVGLSVADAEEKFDQPIHVLSVKRLDATDQVTPRPVTIIKSGDVLTVQAPLSSLAEFASRHGSRVDVDHSAISWTDPFTTKPVGQSAPDSIAMLEVMVAPESALIGRTPSELELRRHRGLIPLAVRRRRGPIRTELKHFRFKAGDSLVVTGHPDRLTELYDSDDVIALHSPNVAYRNRKRAPLAVAVLVAVLAASAFGLVPIAIAMLAGALVLVLTQTLSMEDAYSSIDWKAIFLIAGMLPLGTAMEKTGTARLVAEALTDATGDAGPMWVLLSIYALTVGLTSVISNAAATVLIVPIAIDTALALNVNPQPFVMATVIAASTAFLLPIGHQVNVLVYGPGNYRFGDFARVGAGLTVAIMALTAVLVPLVWPL